MKRNAKILKSSEISAGYPLPLGVSIVDGWTNFSIHVHQADEVTLYLFESDQITPLCSLTLDPSTHRMGDVWHVAIARLPENLTYLYKVRRDKEISHYLLDPYAHKLQSHRDWLFASSSSAYFPRGRISQSPPFDWEGMTSPRLPMKDLVIYEMHVRGFTQSETSKTTHSGKFLGIIEKIPYLKELGVNALELLPVFEFNEQDYPFLNLKTNTLPLCNYFGYSPVNFFSLMNRYGSSDNSDQVLQEFKNLVKELHKNEIEVILDVVYNHTSEGGEKGTAESFRGLDEKAYYMLSSSGEYLNFSGCGNTFNCNHPLSIELIIRSLRYWVIECHVDGFRFDLASIFSRTLTGEINVRSSLIEAISRDSILSETKLIAEAWDASGLYQVGGFYPGLRWSEWNGTYRDVVRRFIKGTAGYKTAFATALCGSQDVFYSKGSPVCGVNFITCHDGFTLTDLVTYNVKYNDNNGEGNRDGSNQNDSWNCGVEGITKNKKILDLRLRQKKNFILALMLSQGVPMIQMGDEYGHTKYGNNNSWCQDNEINWFLWDHLAAEEDFVRFYQALIHFRKQHPILRRNRFLNAKDITWHGETPNHPDWNHDNSLVACSWNDAERNAQLYAAFNASSQNKAVTLPAASWRWVVNTAASSPDDFFEEGKRPPVEEKKIQLLPYSAILLEIGVLTQVTNYLIA